MLETMLFVLIALAFAFMALVIGLRDPVFALIDTILWFVCALGTLEYEIPYSFYNVTTDAVEHGTRIIGSLWPVTYFFMMMGIVMAVSFTVLVLQTLYEKN